MPLHIAARRIPNGKDKDTDAKLWVEAGDIVPGAAKWARLDVAVSRGEIIILSDATIAAIRGAAPVPAASQPDPRIEQLEKTTRELAASGAAMATSLRGALATLAALQTAPSETSEPAKPSTTTEASDAPSDPKKSRK